MEFTYDNVVKWFNEYFAAFNKYAGDPKTVPNMGKYFTSDLEFTSFNANTQRPASRKSLLNSMIHPGVDEELTPLDYIVDLGKKAVAVRLQLKFTEEPMQKVYPLKQSCANYYLVIDNNRDFKIKKIFYFTEHTPPGARSMAELMTEYREKLSTKS